MCKFLRIRSKKYIKYCYCLLLKQEINKDFVVFARTGNIKIRAKSRKKVRNLDI